MKKAFGKPAKRVLWIATGRRYVNLLRTMWRILSSPSFLFGVALVILGVMIFFSISFWWIGLLALSTAALAVLAFLLRRWRATRPLISKRQAARYNDFHYYKVYAGKKFLSKIDNDSERVMDDNVMSAKLFCQLLSTFVELGLYVKVGSTIIKAFSGREFQAANILEFYTDFVLEAGVGYVLLMPSARLMSEAVAVDCKIITRVLLDIGLVDWTVEVVDYGDGIVLFILRDEVKRYEELALNCNIS